MAGTAGIYRLVGLIGPLKLDEIRAEIRGELAAGEPVESYCFHPSTCLFLGVPVDEKRRTLTADTMQRPCALVGIRPLVRPEPGKELEVSETTFQGFHVGIPG